MYIGIHICIFTYLSICMYICKYIHIFMCVCVYIYIYVNVCACTYVCVRVCVCVCVHVCVYHSGSSSRRLKMRTYTISRLTARSTDHHGLSEPADAGKGQNICMVNFVCFLFKDCPSMYVYTYTHAHTHTHTHTRTHIHTHTHTHTHTRTQTKQTHRWKSKKMR